jgi:hypothetical protein
MLGGSRNTPARARHLSSLLRGLGFVVGLSILSGHVSGCTLDFESIGKGGPLGPPGDGGTDMMDARVADTGQHDGRVPPPDAGPDGSPPDATAPECTEATAAIDCAHLSRAQCVDGTCVVRPRPTAPVAYTMTAGGTLATSSQHRLRVFIGVPQPMTSSSSSGHRLTLGPLSLGVPSTAP